MQEESSIENSGKIFVANLKQFKKKKEFNSSKKITEIIFTVY